MCTVLGTLKSMRYFWQKAWISSCVASPLRDDGGVDFFAEFFVRDAKADGVLHGGMLGKDCVDLQGSDLLAAAVYQLLQPAPLC